MTKPKKLRDNRTDGLPAVGEPFPVELEVVEQDAESVTVQPKRLTMDDILGRYVPPECPMCRNLQLPNRRTTYVNGTKTINTKIEIIIERSIKCPHCRASRMDYERIPHSILDQSSTATE